LQGRACRPRPDEYASAGDAYPRGEGTGRRRPCVGEVSCGAVDKGCDRGECLA
jgi:hypothetical protein